MYESKAIKNNTLFGVSTEQIQSIDASVAQEGWLEGKNSPLNYTISSVGGGRATSKSCVITHVTGAAV